MFVGKYWAIEIGPLHGEVGGRGIINGSGDTNRRYNELDRVMGRGMGEWGLLLENKLILRIITQSERDGWQRELIYLIVINEKRTTRTGKLSNLGK